MYDRVKGKGSYVGTAIGVTQVIIGPINYVGRFVTVHEHHAKRFLPDANEGDIERHIEKKGNLASDLKLSGVESLDDFFADLFILKPSRRLDDAYSRLSSFCGAYLTEYGCQPEFTCLNETPLEDVEYVMNDRFLLPLRKGRNVADELTNFTIGLIPSEITQKIIKTRKPSKAVLNSYLTLIKAVKSEDYETAARMRDKLHSKLS